MRIGLQVNSELKNKHPPLAINTVTSFYLSGTVLGLSVSFLVDTGAGVSLITGKYGISLSIMMLKLRLLNTTI